MPSTQGQQAQRAYHRRRTLYRYNVIYTDHECEIELSQYFWPRIVADRLSMTMLRDTYRTFVAVQDLQRYDHTGASYVNGDTYIVNHDHIDADGLTLAQRVQLMRYATADDASRVVGFDQTLVNVMEEAEEALAADGLRITITNGVYGYMKDGA